ncbi:hypothetical protein SADUNF_Sadunf19G0109500 [Salix dunnii]|uniref:Uncharacterized protein n=1 Tax=Salix dunnii TaxID=1413687 RepID=A0A835J4Z0_9ROSI|nr:hypothetical protein SADUNF_Sadunf19G0109500 [Salix dunnii]
MDQLLLDHSNNKALKHLGRGKKEDMKRLVKNSSLPSEDNCSCSTIISSSKNSLILRSPRKNFSRVIRADFFETIMFKRVRDGKGSQCQEHSNANKVLINTDHQVNEANLVRSGSSSISEPRRLSKIKKSSKNPNQELEFKARNMDKSGTYLLLTSLTVMILWGKLCAIFCNLIWLYFLPRRRHNTSRPENVRTSLWLLDKKESKEISTTTRRR